MDGLLIDSEPLWQDAEIEIFGALGVPLTRAMCRQTMGLRIDEVVAYWWARFRWAGPDQATVVEAVVDKVASLIRERGRVLPGVEETIAFVRQRVGAMAIASSSTTEVIKAVMETLDLERHFDVIHSAENERYGKPHPGVFLSAAAKAGAASERCVAIEDSLNGVIAAKAARMTCVAVPQEHGGELDRFAVADLVVRSLGDLPGRWDELVPRTPSTN